MSTRGRHLMFAGLAAVAGLATACADDAGPERADPTDTGATTTTVDATSTTTATTSTTTVPLHPVAPNGRTYPSVPAEADAAAARIHEIERILHFDEIDETDEEWADLAHEQQMLYRVIARNPDWVRTTLDSETEEFAPVIASHLAARQSIADIGHGGDPPTHVPAWEIIEPLPAAELRALYEAAEADTGIGWSFLAAINMIETGFGRIDGLSTAGAQGPMQFLPTTWEEVSDGDISDPYDAIPAAARYLVRRGGPADMHRALFGYNNSDAYVAAVTHYANLFRDDERSYLAAHRWEIHYSAAIGDLWFPVGFRVEEATPVETYLADAPWSAPPPPA